MKCLGWFTWEAALVSASFSPSIIQNNSEQNYNRRQCMLLWLWSLRRLSPSHTWHSLTRRSLFRAWGGMASPLMIQHTSPKHRWGWGELLPQTPLAASCACRIHSGLQLTPQYQSSPPLTNLVLTPVPKALLYCNWQSKIQIRAVARCSMFQLIKAIGRISPGWKSLSSWGFVFCSFCLVFVLALVFVFVFFSFWFEILSLFPQWYREKTPKDSLS